MTGPEPIGQFAQKGVGGGLILYAALGRYPSGQRGQSVKLLRELRWFESNPAHPSKQLARLLAGVDSFRAHCDVSARLGSPAIWSILGRP